MARSPACSSSTSSASRDTSPRTRTPSPTRTGRVSPGTSGPSPVAPGCRSTGRHTDASAGADPGHLRFHRISGETGPCVHATSGVIRGQASHDVGTPPVRRSSPPWVTTIVRAPRQAVCLVGIGHAGASGPSGSSFGPSGSGSTTGQRPSTGSALIPAVLGTAVSLCGGLVLLRRGCKLEFDEEPAAYFDRGMWRRCEGGSSDVAPDLQAIAERRSYPGIEGAARDGRVTSAPRSRRSWSASVSYRGEKCGSTANARSSNSTAVRSSPIAAAMVPAWK